MSILTSLLILLTLTCLGLSIQYKNRRVPDWYYCHDDLYDPFTKLFFTPNGTNGVLRVFLQDLEQTSQMVYYSPYNIDEGGYVNLGDSTSGSSLNNSKTFPYMSAHYTLKYDSENDVVTMTNTSGTEIKYTPCNSQASTSPHRHRILSEEGPSALYPYPYYCSDKMCINIIQSFGKWIIKGFISTESLRTTPCWHWLIIWTPFDVNSQTVNITGPYASFNFTFQRVNASALQVQPHNSAEGATLLYGLNDQPNK